MKQEATTTHIKDLGDGFILRRATNRDIDALIEFNHKIHDDGNWTKALLSGHHPTTSVDDFILVEETSTGKIVSTMGMIPQVWSYAGVEMKVARPDLVGTDPDYRNRGFVREQFEVLHRMSQERGHLLQVLVGRPWFYRQFGYTMAIPYGGGWEVDLSELPALKDGEEEPLVIRPAVCEDISFIRKLYDRSRERQLLSCLRDERLWSFEMLERDDEEQKRVAHRIIEDRTGQCVGFLVHAPLADGPVYPLFVCELEPSVSLIKAAPTILRYLKGLGQDYQRSHPELTGKPLVGDLVERVSPLLDALPDLLARQYKPLAWYTRVPDMIALFERIIPVLERRLASSVAAGHTGRLALSFWRGGMKLSFEQGRLVAIEDWPRPEKRGDANLPIENFIQLIFGVRSIGELVEIYNPEVAANKDAQLLLSILFPKQASAVFSVC